MGRPKGRTAAAAAATATTADARTMTSGPALSSKGASTGSMPQRPPPPAAAAAAAVIATTGMTMGAEADGGVAVVRIAGRRFVPDHVVLRGRGRTVRWVNEEGSGCVWVVGCGLWFREWGWLVDGPID